VTAHDVPLAVLRRTRDAYRLARTAMAYRVRARTRELVAVSPYVAQAWRRQMGYRRPITIVPNIAPALEPSPGTARTTAVLAVADGGRLKNVQALVGAAGILRTEGLDLHLRLVGPGLEDESPFAARVRAAGLAEGVVFRGPLGRADLATELAGARVFAHPSLEECCPMAVLEAMSAGLPVVAGRASGGTPWVLGHGEAGLLVDVRDAQSLAEGIRQVLVDDELVRRLVGAAGRRVDQVFSTQAVVAAYAAEYYRVLGTTPRRRGETATRVFA
jgi:glycosyltransferase involved in cell wall biosynthesis